MTAVRKPLDLADVDVAVVRAVLGVAESGSCYWCPVFKKRTRTPYFGPPATRYFIRIYGAQGVRSLTVIVDG
jgi:hypothetical protein